MCTHLHSCVNLTIGAWLLAHPNTPSFCLSSTHVFIAFHICLSIPILQFHIFHAASVVIALMIWVFICYVVCVGVNALQSMIRFEIPSHQKVEFMYKGRFFTFSPAIHENGSILSSLKTIFEPWWTLSLSIRLIKSWCSVFQQQHCMQ